MGAVFAEAAEGVGAAVAVYVDVDTVGVVAAEVVIVPGGGGGAGADEAGEIGCGEEVAVLFPGGLELADIDAVDVGRVAHEKDPVYVEIEHLRPDGFGAVIGAGDHADGDAAALAPGEGGSEGVGIILAGEDLAAVRGEAFDMVAIGRVRAEAGDVEFRDVVVIGEAGGLRGGDRLAGGIEHREQQGFLIRARAVEQVGTVRGDGSDHWTGGVGLAAGKQPSGRKPQRRPSERAKQSTQTNHHPSS